MFDFRKWSWTTYLWLWKSFKWLNCFFYSTQILKTLHSNACPIKYKMFFTLLLWCFWVELFHHQLWLKMLRDIVVVTSHLLHNFHTSFLLSYSILFYLNLFLSSIVSKPSFEMSDLRSMLLPHLIKLLNPLYLSILNNFQIFLLVLFKWIPVIYLFSSPHIIKSQTFFRLNFSDILLVFFL